MATQSISYGSGGKQSPLTTYQATLGLAKSRDRHSANNGEDEKDCQSRIAVEDGEHQPHLLKRFHSAFSLFLRDELGGGVYSAVTFPAGKLCMHSCSWGQRLPLAVSPTSRTADARHVPISRAIDKRPLTTYQAAAAQRDARPGRIRRALLIAAAIAATIPAAQMVEHVARKTSATVELAERCRGIPACNPLEMVARHD
ncbi:hypothetical protein [Roseovarius sp. D0-M9]|uniref:hypothetical protein n=1 Tax=Roseovarius sp. D0-M9 TaxID=3127117 RepID=UPI00300FE322